MDIYIEIELNSEIIFIVYDKNPTLKRNFLTTLPSDSPVITADAVKWLELIITTHTIV